MGKLYLEQKFLKIYDDYPVYNDNGEIVFYVRQDPSLIQFRFNVYDSFNNYIFTIEKKILALLAKYNLTFSDGRKYTFKQQLGLTIKLETLETSDVYFNIKGKGLSGEFKVYANDQYIGLIKKKIFALKDIFEINFDNHMYMDILLGITIAIDNIMDTND